jgi:mRNA interferase RelE/StbE
MAVWRVLLLRPARSYLERLSPDERNRILDALEQLVKDPKNADLRKLQGRAELRLRVGNKRVLLIPDRLQKLIIVTRIGPRGDIYK